MAGDRGIADAYARYFHAQEEANLQSDPFYQATLIATQAAQEWQFEKKQDKERAQKRADSLIAKSDDMFMNALDGYNPQAQELGYAHLENFTNRMNAAAAQGDKKLMNQIHSETQAFANQLKQGQTILAEHAKALKEGKYSEGAGTASLNKFLSGGPNDYEVFMETDPNKPNYNQLHFRTKGEDGGLDVKEFSFNQFDKYNVQRADAFGDGYDKLLKGMVKEAADSGMYEFDGGQVERLLKKQLADSDVVYSAFHDPIFGEDQSIKEWFNTDGGRGEKYGANRDWQNIWNDKIPVFQPTEETGTVRSGGQGVQNSGYDEETIRQITQDRLMEMAEAEFDTRLKAYQKKVSASKNTVSHEYGINPGTYTYVPGMEKGAIGADKVRAAKHIEANKKFAYNNNMVYKPTNKGWMVKEIDADEDEYTPILLEDMITQLGLPMDIRFNLPG